MKKIKSYFRKIFRLLPRIGIFYVLCQRYVDDFRGEHNSDMFSNGELRFLKNNARKFRTVFDVGANVGDWSKFALGLNKTIKLHCFEPSKFTFGKLEKNLPAGVFCNNIGLGSKKEKKELFVVDGGAGGNSLYKRRGVKKEAGQTEEISLDTLENYCRQNKIKEIDFVKIDTEGHDLEVMRGMGKLLKENRIGMIQFEYGGCNIDARVFLKDIFEFFEKLEYGIYKIFPNKIVRIGKYRQDLDNFRYANYLVIQNKIKSA